MNSMIQQIEFLLTAKPLVCHFVTQEIISHLPKELLQTGLINIFVQHIHVGGCSSVHNPLSPLVIFPPPQTFFPVMPLYLASVGTAPCFAMRNVS